MTDIASTRLPRRSLRATVGQSSSDETSPPMWVTLVTAVGIAGMAASLTYALVTLGILSLNIGIFA